MAVVRFDPFRGFESLARRMNRVVSEFDKGFSFESGGFNPRVDISEADDKIFVHAELPGLLKADVKISLNEDRVLTIKGEKKKEDLEEGKTYVRKEISLGNFARSFILPETIDMDSISAKFENGVLEVSIDKKEPEKPKEVEVEIK